MKIQLTSQILLTTKMPYFLNLLMLFKNGISSSKPTQQPLIIQNNKTNQAMPKRTETSEAPTNFTEKESQGSASSCIINRKRDMFQPLNATNSQTVNPKHIVQQNSIKLIPKNVLLMNPIHAKSVIWPQIFMPDQELAVSLKGNFYSIKDSRNKQRFINRNSMPNSQVVHFNVSKNGDKIVMSSVERFIVRNEEKIDELWYHFDIAVFNIENEDVEKLSSVEKGFAEASSAKTAANLALKIGETYYFDFKGFQLIDNNKKAFAVFEPIGVERNRYEVIMIDFQKSRDAQTNYDSMSEILGSRKFLKYNLETKRVGMINLERKETEVYKKLINSQFGDIVLLVTSHEIYEIQIAGQLTENQYTLILKPFQICKIFSENKNTYVSNQTNQLVLSKEMFSKEQKIIDASYIMNGLKIMILTSHGRVFVVQSEQCIFSESLYEMLSNKEMVFNYNIEYFVFKNIYFLRGLLVVEVEAEKSQDCNLVRQPKYEDSILDKLDERKNTLEYVSRGLIIAKVQSNSLSFSKFISLPFHITNYEYLRVHPFTQADELLIQVLSQKDPQSLELHRCQIISNRNSFIPFSVVHLIREPKIMISNSVSNSSVIEREVDTKVPSKVAFGKSNKSFYILKGNQVSGCRIHNNEFVSVLQNGIQKTLSTSFFEKPQKIITNPLSGQVVILFRQFIKFFMSVYSELNLVFMINIRQVKDICFSKHGESLIICMNDNSINLLDSYRFTEKKIMEFYGDLKQVNHATEYLLAIRSCRNVLNIFRKREKPIVTNNGKNNSQVLEYYEKLYDIKLDSQDSYHVDETLTMVMKKNGSLEIYSHIPEDRTVKDTIDQKQTIIFNLLSKEHPHLINKKKISLEKSEYPTYCFYSCSFSTLFVGTSHGNIKQFLYPFLSIEDPSPPECYTYPVANNEIVHIEVNADFSSLYAVTELGQVVELKFEQFLNGHKKNGIYLVSKTQNFQHMIKYEFANRNYLIDDFTPTNEQQKMFMIEQYEETCFADDKIKNEIQDTTNKIKSQSAKIINSLSVEKKTFDKQFRNEFNTISNQLKEQQRIITEKIDQLQAHHDRQKDSIIDQHERELLDIYRQSDRLSYILKSKTSEFAQNAAHLRQELNLVLEKQIALKEEETMKLEEEYKQLEEKYKIYTNVAVDEVSQNQAQLQNYKHQEIGKIQDKLKAQQQKKQSQLSRMGKIQKQIQRYKKRSIYFENLIVETRNQIEQLNNDVLLYNQKKVSLVKELQQKESTIQQKQTQLVRYLKTTNEMKKIKNVHQFELNQFEGDLLPIQDKIFQLEKQVQNINNQIMDQFNSKLEQDSCIQSSKKRIEKLKTKNYCIVQNLLKSRTQLLRFTQSLTAVLAEDPFALNTKKKLAKMVEHFSKDNQVFVGNEEIEKAKKYGLNLMRKKNMVAKAIERQQKLEEGIVRNKNQFFRFYSDNTNLVKEYNELFKDHNTLMKEKSILLDKIKALKVSTYQTPLKRTASLHIRKVSEKKLTPFQRYEQEQLQFNTIKLKQGDTTETRVSRGESSSFLKSLIKDVSIAENNFEKSNMVRERIRTFVNPEMQRKTIQKQLFQMERERGKSNHVPLLKL